MKEPLWKQINLFRIFPRLALLFMLWMTWLSFHWFTTLETPNESQAAVVIAVTGSTIGFGKWYLEKRPLDTQSE